MNSTSAGIQAGFPWRCVCGSRRSRMRTSQPAARAASTTWEPMRPAPPVTSAVVRFVIPRLHFVPRLERPPEESWVTAHDPGVDSPNPARRDDRQDDERDVLVRLLEHPAVAREVDGGQEELLTETDQGAESRRETQDQQGADTEFGEGHQPLKE